MFLIQRDLRDASLFRSIDARGQRNIFWRTEIIILTSCGPGSGIESLPQRTSARSDSEVARPAPVRATFRIRPQAGAEIEFVHSHLDHTFGGFIQLTVALDLLGGYARIATGVSLVSFKTAQVA